MSQRFGLPTDAWVYLVNGLILTCSQGSCIVFVVPCWTLDNVAVAMNASMDSVLDIGNKFLGPSAVAFGGECVVYEVAEVGMFRPGMACMHLSCVYIMRYTTIGILFMILLGMVFHLRMVKELLMNVYFRMLEPVRTRLVISCFFGAAGGIVKYGSVSGFCGVGVIISRVSCADVSGHS